MPVSLLTGEIGSVIGEYFESVRTPATAITLPATGQNGNVVALTLQPGDWDVEGSVVFFHQGVTGVSGRLLGISTASITLPQDGHEAWNQNSTPANARVSLFTAKRLSLGVTTNVYLVGSTTFTGGSCTVWGFLGARRAS